MSNHLYANYLATDMEEVSPHDKHLVIFSVSIVFADSCYTIAARRDDCGGLYERHVDSYNYRQIMRAVCHVLRHLRGHDTQQFANLAQVPDVHGLMMVLGLCMDNDASRELFAALAGSNLRPDDDATLVADYLNA